MGLLLHVRYDEIALKGGRRSWYEKKLCGYLAFQTGVPYARVDRIRGRLLIRLDKEDPRQVLEGVARTFGVASASLVHEVEPILPALEAKAAELGKAQFERGLGSFKIEVRRPDKSFPHSSYEIAVALGNAVGEASPELRVDVHEPDFVIKVEVRPEGTYVFSDATPGPGGMPTGTAGRGLCLLSGGIDSPVAAWYSLKRGLAVDYCYFHAFPYTGDKVLEKVLSLARTLSRWTPSPVRVFVPSTTEIQDAIAAGAPDPLRIVLLRRSMHRLARAILRVRGYKALVTGEALGQVASQTPENLLCVETAIPDVLVLRPLLGFDKQEIMERARLIDTYETSVLPYQDCCSLFAPQRPETAAKPHACEEVEAKLELEPLEARSLEGLSVYRIERGGAAERLDEGLRKRGPRAPGAPAGG